MSFIRDLSSRAIWVIVGLCLTFALAFWLYMHRAKTLPPIVFQDSEGQRVDFETMRAGKEHTVVVLLLPGCSISKFSLGLVKEQHGKWSQQLSFVGLLMGDQAQADQFTEKKAVGFPVYGLRSATDPFAINELIRAVGDSGGVRSSVYGGTIIVVDEDRKIIVNLSRDEVRGLPDELASLVD